MMAAIPSPWNLRSVRSQNDLKPRICSRFSLSNVNSLEKQWPVASYQQPVVRCDDRQPVYQVDTSSAEMVLAQINSLPGWIGQAQIRATVTVKSGRGQAI
jgi:hypothetical protein